jgi:hypothetical protein
LALVYTSNKYEKPPLPFPFFFFLFTHYKISQFYRRTNSVGVWLEVCRWFFYRRHHRRITSVGFIFVGNSPFRRYIGRKNKKIICRWFYRRNLRAKKKKIPAWNIPTDFYSVGDIVIDRRNLSVGKSIGECMKYRPNISVCKFVGTDGSLLLNADGLILSVSF